MVFDDVGTHASALPPAEYLPALERQRELEAQLLAQQVSIPAVTFCYHYYGV